MNEENLANAPVVLSLPNEGGVIIGRAGLEEESILTKDHQALSRREFSEAALAATAGFLVPRDSFALQENSLPGSAPSGARNIVLVHGAFADGTSWNKVIPLLEAKGFVTAVIRSCKDSW